MNPKIVGMVVQFVNWIFVRAYGGIDIIIHGYRVKFVK
jgi:hypothetical protein